MRYHRSYAHASATILRPMPKSNRYESVSSLPPPAVLCLHVFLQSLDLFESNEQARPSSAHQGFPPPPPSVKPENCNEP